MNKLSARNDIILLIREKGLTNSDVEVTCYEVEYTQIAQYVSGRRQYVSGRNLSVRPTLFRKLWLQNMLSLYKYFLLLKHKATFGYIYSKLCFIFSLNIVNNSSVDPSISQR